MVNSHLNNIINEWNISVSKVLVPLKTFGDINKEHILELKNNTAKIVQILKGQELVSKRLIADLHAIPYMVRSEIEYRKEKEELEQLADYLEYCFGLILANEVPADRASNRPRII